MARGRARRVFKVGLSRLFRDWLRELVVVVVVVDAGDGLGRCVAARGSILGWALVGTVLPGARGVMMPRRFRSEFVKSPVRGWAMRRLLFCCSDILKKNKSTVEEPS